MGRRQHTLEGAHPALTVPNSCASLWGTTVKPALPQPTPEMAAAQSIKGAGVFQRHPLLPIQPTRSSRSPWQWLALCTPAPSLSPRSVSKEGPQLPRAWGPRIRDLQSWEPSRGLPQHSQAQTPRGCPGEAVHTDIPFSTTGHPNPPSCYIPPPPYAQPPTQSRATRLSIPLPPWHSACPPTLPPTCLPINPFIHPPLMALCASTYFCTHSPLHPCPPNSSLCIHPFPHPSMSPGLWPLTSPTAPSSTALPLPRPKQPGQETHPLHVLPHTPFSTTDPLPPAQSCSATNTAVSPAYPQALGSRLQ